MIFFHRTKMWKDFLSFEPTHSTQFQICNSQIPKHVTVQSKQITVILQINKLVVYVNFNKEKKHTFSLTFLYHCL